MKQVELVRKLLLPVSIVFLAVILISGCARLATPVTEIPEDSAACVDCHTSKDKLVANIDPSTEDDGGGSSGEG
jgi:hypothetical protein